MVMESLQRLDPPRTLGKMTLLARLGEGGMASVYVASVGEGALARLAAVKLLRQGAPDHDYRTRFLDEAKVVSRLHHNNLVDVREAGEVDGQLYIAMELIEGRDLADIWDRCAEVGRAFPIPIAVHVAREILRGLHYAHTFPGLGLVHRDVSPSNILIDWAGAVRLADFGLATSALKASMTVPGVVFGKLGYMAPEQATHQPLDARTDVYGCGVVLWELITGRPFRSGQTSTRDVAGFVAKRPSTSSRRVDAELDDIVMRALERDPEARFGTALEFMKALSAWLASHAPQTNQETVAEFMHGLFGPARARDQAAYLKLLESLPRTGAWERVRRADDPQTGDVESSTVDLDTIAAGTIVADRYRIERSLGRGGMGVVYLAEHLRVGRKVAIKVLSHEWSNHDVVANRFREEARAASAAGHPNIVEVFDAGELPDGRLFLVMEYLVGRSFYDAIVEDGPMPVERACKIVRDIARAVKAAHDVGIIHRDLKPDNVMLVARSDGEVVKVLDFGISASAVRSEADQRLTRPGHALGTPEYMAPEQAKGKDPNERFDIYALGVLLYEALTGAPPFASENMVEVLTRKATEPAPAIFERRGDLPPDVCALVHRCLEIEPELRPQSAAELIAGLDAILERRETTATVADRAPGVEETLRGAGTSMTRVDRKPARTGPPWWAVGAGALALAAGVFAAFLVGRGGVAERTVDAEVEAHTARDAETVPAQGLVVAAPVHGPAGGAERPTADARAPVGDDDPSGDPPAGAVPDPSDDETEAAGKGQVPVAADEATGAGSSDPEPDPSASAVCRRTRDAADDAERSRDWKALLRHLDRQACWGPKHRARFVALRVRALFEAGRFDDCARYQGRARDSKTRALVDECRRRVH